MNEPEAVSADAATYERIEDVSPTDERVELNPDDVGAEPMPAVEAFAAAIAASTHQHLAATPEDAPAQPGKLPFPRPPFDVEKHLRRLSEKHEEIRELTVFVLRADEEAKKAAKAKQSAHEELDTAREELDELVKVMLEDHQAEQDGPKEQLALQEPGRQPCAWEREHPGQVCTICAAGQAHETVADVVEAVTDVVSAIVETAPSGSGKPCGCDPGANWLCEEHRHRVVVPS